MLNQSVCCNIFIFNKNLSVELFNQLDSSCNLFFYLEENRVYFQRYYRFSF